MPDIALRQLAGDERLDVIHALGAYAFDPSPPLPDKEEWRGMIESRSGVTYVGVFEDGAAASVAASSAMRHNARGKVFDAGGVWGVATGPAFRRKGYCRAAMTRLLELCRSEGQAFSTLYPFRASFYERLGYVTMPLPLIARLSPANLAPLLKADLPGRVTVSLLAERYDAYRAFLTRLLDRTHGMGLFVDPDSGNPGLKRSWLALAEVAGRVEGAMLYSLKGDGDERLMFHASRLYATSAAGRRLLLQWIGRHVDQATRAELWLAPAELPETWLPDMDVKVETARLAPMGRVLDTAAIGGMRVGPGGFTAAISDPICPWNAGVWRFESDGGALRVGRADHAECALTIQGLSALVYGCPEPESFGLRGWGEVSAETAAVMGEMFPPARPHLHERF